MKIKVEDLNGKALDFATAVALGYIPEVLPGNVLRSPGRPAEALGSGEIKLDHPTHSTFFLTGFSPSRDDEDGWAIVGPMVSKHRISLDSTIDTEGGYLAICKGGEHYGVSGYGDTAAFAICMCIVSMHVEEDDMIEIPDEVNLKINGGDA